MPREPLNKKITDAEGRIHVHALNHEQRRTRHINQNLIKYAVGDGIL